jgi:GTP diphosphokinase / guanosine-3',5'-bis(diphosphate) 3'-diphosphatase
MPDLNDLNQLFSAIRFAADKHRSQRRKDTEKTPYINHPIQVVETLWRVGQVRDEDILIAAVLHDTLEDTDTTEKELGELFGQAVLGYVKEVTDDKSLPKARRKELQIEHAPYKSHGAKKIKLADKLCNIHDLAHTPPSDWPLERRQEYFDWSEKVVAGLRGTNPALEALYDVSLAEARASLLIGKKAR